MPGETTTTADFRGGEWPAATSALEAGRAFLRERCRTGRVVAAFHGDVDGLAAAVIAIRALERLGNRDVLPLPTGKGESIHSPPMAARLAAARPEALLVLDTGSRAGRILPGVPTLIVDHHVPAGVPEDAVFVSAASHPPVAPAALLTYVLAGGVVESSDLDWLAALGTVADLGFANPFAEIAAVVRRFGRHRVREAVSLLNAAKRAPAHDVACAFAALVAARSPADIAAGHGEPIERLRRYREEVRREANRCARARPAFAGQAALLRFSSPAQVHPLVAARWARRLPRHVVIAANEGYLPGRVNFSLRTALAVDLIAFLHRLRPSGLTGDYAYGHPQATGGSLTVAEFERLLAALGFSEAGGLRTSSAEADHA